MLAVVSDSSPLIYLTRLRQFPLLQLLHDAVYVPQAVWQEVAVRGQGYPEAAALRGAVTDGWIHVKQPSLTALSLGPDAYQLGQADIDSILLARELNAILLTDDTEARQLAERVAVKVSGTVGLLIRAKTTGHIQQLRVLLDELRSNTNFRMSERLYTSALQAVGEL
jgi:hypothetical protein